jgi:hypothetical protein
MATFNIVFNPAVPADSSFARFGAKEFRDLKKALEERLNLEHVAPGLGNQDPDSNLSDGRHRPGEVSVCYVGTLAQVEALSPKGSGCLGYSTDLGIIHIWNGTSWIRSSQIGTEFNFNEMLTANTEGTVKSAYYTHVRRLYLNRGPTDFNALVHDDGHMAVRFGQPVPRPLTLSFKLAKADILCSWFVSRMKDFASTHSPQLTCEVRETPSSTIRRLHRFLPPYYSDYGGTFIIPKGCYFRVWLENGVDVPDIADYSLNERIQIALTPMQKITPFYE